ncbi:MAG TPA: C40 family peptidase [Candidatus Limosilactobacillus gallistercoris]|nr:C40 family peptidase [Candidatus Limosilactobacillus gallistercoris]
MSKTLIATLGAAGALTMATGASADTQVQVQAGDTVWGFAQQYNSTVDTIAQRNQLANPNLIQVGQQLIIPDSATSAVSQATSDTAAIANNAPAASAANTTNSASDTTVFPLSTTNTVTLTNGSAAPLSSAATSSNSASLATGLDQVTTLSNATTNTAVAATTNNASSAATSQTSYEANSAAALQSMSNYAISYGTVEETAASYNTTSQASAQPAQAADNATQSSDTASANTSSAVATARSMIGVPYVWGGNTPSGFDCSGLVQYSYNLGPNYRTTYQQTNLGQHKYDVENAQSGDLYFWGTESAPYHVAIAEGNGNYIQAPTPGQNVQEGNIQYYRPNFYISMNQ